MDACMYICCVTVVCWHHWIATTLRCRDFKRLMSIHHNLQISQQTLPALPRPATLPKARPVHNCTASLRLLRHSTDMHTAQPYKSFSVYNYICQPESSHKQANRTAYLYSSIFPLLSLHLGLTHT